MRPSSAEPDLSIVIVSWNTCEILRDCLKTVRDGLGGLAAEVFIVDNASKDDSAAMVEREFPEFHLLRMERNLGFAGGNNVALREARGRHVLLLNSDTLVLGDVLSCCMAWLDAHPRVAVMGCRVVNADRTTQSTCFQDPSLVNLLLDALFLSSLRWPRFFGRYQMRHWGRDDEREVDVVTGCFMLVRRLAMDAVGLLDDTFFFCAEEADWCLRFRRAGWGVMFAPVGEIVHLDGASGRKLSAQRDVFLYAGLLHWHLKHGSGMTVWTASQILRGGLRLRRTLWLLRSWLPRGTHAAARCQHLGVVLGRWAEVHERAKATEPPRPTT